MKMEWLLSFPRSDFSPGRPALSLNLPSHKSSTAQWPLVEPGDSAAALPVDLHDGRMASGQDVEQAAGQESTPESPKSQKGINTPSSTTARKDDIVLRLPPGTPIR